MARLIRHDATGPYEVKPSDKSTWICMCGLSKKRPYCDGTHSRLPEEEEGKLYRYDDALKQEEVQA